MLTDSHPPQIFASKVDEWLRVVTRGGALVPIGALITLAARGERGALWIIPRAPDPRNLAAVAPLVD